MKKFRFLFLVLALILVVGMTTGLIVRKQTGGQSVMHHSSASAPVSTTPATTGDDEPAAPEAEAQVAKILLLVDRDDDYSVIVNENNINLEPIDSVVYVYDSPNVLCSENHRGGGDPEYQSGYYVDRYLVDPSNTTVTIQSIEQSKDFRGGDSPIGWIHYVFASSYYDSFYFTQRNIYESSLPDHFVLSDGYTFVFIDFGNVITISD